MGGRLSSPLCSADAAALQVIALILGMSDGEALAGEGSALLDGGEELAFFHAGEEQGGAAGTAAHFKRGVVAVDIVDLAASLLYV